MEQLMNQEVARLRHAELLRNATRRHALPKEVQDVTRAPGFRARFARLLRSPSHVAALRPR
jgi:hypothetical protein